MKAFKNSPTVFGVEIGEVGRKHEIERIESNGLDKLKETKSID
jgi:hypothetical protein